MEGAALCILDRPLASMREFARPSSPVRASGYHGDSTHPAQAVQESTRGELETEKEREALRLAALGNPNQVGQVLEEYSPRLRNMLRLRMAPQLAGRVGVSDVLQEAFVEVTERLPGYLEERAIPSDAGKDRRGAMPFYLWVRFLAGQQLARAYRFHLGTPLRDAAREQAIDGPAFPGASSACLAIALADSGVSPSQAASAQEAQEILVEALEDLDPDEREILMMRHFEHLTNREIAVLLDLSEPGASLRHMRALKRLRTVLAQRGLEFPG